MKFNKQRKQIIQLYSSTLLGVVLGIFVSVLNTRNLGPSSYGDVRYVTNLFNFISSFLLFGYFVSGSRLLAISKSKLNSQSIRGIMVVILGITVLVTMFLLLVGAVVEYVWFNKEIVSLILYAVPVCATPLMLNYINTTAQGDNHIGRIAAARLFPSFVYLIVGYLVYRYWGATSTKMLLLQNGIAIFVFSCIIWSTRPSFGYLKASFKRLNRENKRYGRPVYWGSISNVSLSYLAGITLGIYNAANVDVGFYTLALTVATPLSMLPSIIGTTYFKRFAVSNQISNKIMLGTIILTIVSCVVFVMIINPVVRILYDESYSPVAYYASFLAIGTSIHGLGDMVNRFLGAHGQGKYLRNGAFMSGAILLIGSFGFVFLWGIGGAILSRILSSVVFCGSMIYYYIQFTQKMKAI